MAFYVPPSHACGELRRLITAGGGKVAEKAGKDVINVMPEGLQHKKVQKLEDAISSRFIMDCMARKSLLPLADYRLGSRVAAPAEAAAPAASAGQPAAPAQQPAAAPAKAAHTKKSRDKFTKEEDAALVEWVKNNPSLKCQGKDIWVRAVNAKVTGHSWQSMQNRYRRYLREKKKDDLRKSLARGAEAAREAPAAAAGRGPGAAAAADAVEETDLIEDFSQPKAISKRKAPEAEAERPRWRKSLSVWQLRKCKRGDRWDEATPTQEVATRKTLGGVVPEAIAPAYQPPQVGNSQALMARPVKRMMLDPFAGVPQWILDTQDLEKAAEISLLA